jgi:superfamily II DNA or RNA helicase
LNSGFDIVVKKVNEATVFVDCRTSIQRELTTFFSVFADNYRFNPKYKQGVWDGRLRFFDYKNNLPIGLCAKLNNFAKQGRYTIKYDFELGTKVDLEEFTAFVAALKITDDEGNPMEPRDFQLRAAYDALCKNHLNIASSTASGKSLILYMIVRWLMAHDEKTICIVPSVQLVEQLFGDFYLYGWNKVEDHCCRIYGGQKRMMEKPVQISTWQSLYQDLEEFAKFDAILLDEAHGAKAKSLSGVMLHSINAKYRVGVSGSFPDTDTASWFTVVGGTGPIKVYSTYKSLQDAGFISQIKINTIRLKYPSFIKEKNFKDNTEYAAETDFVNGLTERITFIQKLTQSLEGNTLILFTKKEKHGYPLRAALSASLKGKMVLYIDGDTPPKEREMIRGVMEANGNCVLIATYGTLSTGVNIKRIHNIIFASGYKSRVKIIQSIGRGLRKYKDKVFLKLFDIIDDLAIVDKVRKIRYVNYSLLHYLERSKIYKKEQFEVKLSEYELKIPKEKHD